MQTNGEGDQKRVFDILIARRNENPCLRSRHKSCHTVTDHSSLTHSCYPGSSYVRVVIRHSRIHASSLIASFSLFQVRLVVVMVVMVVMAVTVVIVMMVMVVTAVIVISDDGGSCCCCCLTWLSIVVFFMSWCFGLN